MAYSKINWENAPSTNTPIDANNLNHMDQGIYNNSLKADQVGDLTTLTTTNKTSIVGAINEVNGKIKSADITGTTNANGEVDLTAFNSNFTPSKIVIFGVKVTNSIYYVTTNSAGTTLFVGFRNRGTSYSPVASGISMSFTIYYIEI